MRCLRGGRRRGHVRPVHLRHRMGKNSRSLRGGGYAREEANHRPEPKQVVWFLDVCFSGLGTFRVHHVPPDSPARVSRVFCIGTVDALTTCMQQTRSVIVDYVRRLCTAGHLALKGSSFVGHRRGVQTSGLALESISSAPKLAVSVICILKVHAPVSSAPKRVFCEKAAPL